MKVMPKKLLALFVLTLAGCSSVTSTTSIVKATPTFTPTAPPAITITPTPTPQPSATPEYIKTQCLDILPSLPTDLDFHEGLVFVGFGIPTYISDLRKGTLRTLKLTSVSYGESISPDGKWLTYYLPSASGRPPSFVVIESIDGKQQIKLPWDKKWIDYAGPLWLDNEQIMLSVLFGQDQPLPKTLDTKTLDLLRIPSAVVINPFSGEQRNLPVSNYPGILWIQGSTPEFAFGYTSVVYNPALTLALYATEADYTKSTERRVVLWDMQAGRAIATLPGFAQKNPAFWSSAEAKFLLLLVKFNNHGDRVEDWFSLDPNGHAEQLTRFEDLMDTTASIYSPNLSPDGEAIAFWLTVNPQEEQKLLVLNLKTHEITKYCFQVPASGLWGTPIWSLDGRFLMMTTKNPERNDDNQTAQVNYLSYLIDLQKNWIVQIDKSNDEPIGFVVEP